MKKLGQYLSIMGLLIPLGQPLLAQDVARDSLLQEVEVTAVRHSFGAKSPQMSAVAISADCIRQLPRLLGEVDVLKSLQMMPGLQVERRGGRIIIRRGGADEDQ